MLSKERGIRWLVIVLTQGVYHAPRTVEEVDEECPVVRGKKEILIPAQMGDRDMARVVVEEKAKIARLQRETA